MLYPAELLNLIIKIMSHLNHKLPTFRCDLNAHLPVRLYDSKCVKKLSQKVLAFTSPVLYPAELLNLIIKIMSHLNHKLPTFRCDLNAHLPVRLYDSKCVKKLSQKVLAFTSPVLYPAELLNLIYFAA